MPGRDWKGLGRHGEGHRARRRGQDRGTAPCWGGPHISEPSHVPGQPLSLHHVPAAPTQPLCSCFYLLGQALAHLSGLQGGNRMVRAAQLTFGILNPLLLGAKLEVFKNQDQSRYQIITTDASSWYGCISAHARTLVLLLGIP